MYNILKIYVGIIVFFLLAILIIKNYGKLITALSFILYLLVLAFPKQLISILVLIIILTLFAFYKKRGVHEKS